MTPDERRRFQTPLLSLAVSLPFVMTRILPLRRACGKPRYLIGITTLICAVCYAATKRLVGVVQRLTLKRGMFGYDINKR